MLNSVLYCNARCTFVSASVFSAMCLHAGSDCVEFDCCGYEECPPETLQCHCQWSMIEITNIVTIFLGAVSFFFLKCDQQISFLNTMNGSDFDSLSKFLTFQEAKWLPCVISTYYPHFWETVCTHLHLENCVSKKKWKGGNSLAAVQCISWIQSTTLQLQNVQMSWNSGS